MRRMTTLGGVASIVSAIVLAAGCGGSDESGSGGVKADQNAGGTVGKGTPAQKGGEMTVGLAEDPDQLDPTLARTFVGRIVFANMCEKLYDLDENLKIVPQLASALPDISGDGKSVTIKLRSGIKFNDGTKFDAAAVKTSIDRHRTLKESSRASELAPVSSVTAVDPTTVKIELSKPFAPLTAQLADRSGMVMSPKQLKKLGDKFANNPVCVGPFKFSQRTESDKIVLVRAPDYYDASKVKLDKLTFKIITESSARASNLRSGDVDVIDRLEPTDLPTIKKDPKLQTLAVTSLGYQGLTVNIGNKNGLGKPPKNVGTPLAKDAKLREAFDAAIDRKGIAKIVYDNGVEPGCSPISPVNPFHDESQQCPEPRRCQGEEARQGERRDDAGAGDADAQHRRGHRAPRPGHPGDDEGGRLRGQAAADGVHQRARQGRRGPVRHVPARLVGPRRSRRRHLRVRRQQGLAQRSRATRTTKLDALLDKARQTNDEAQRKDLYKQAVAVINQDRPLIYLFHEKYITGASKKVAGLKVFGDGLLRFKEAGLTAG